MPTVRPLVLAVLVALAGRAQAQMYAFRTYGAEAGLPVAYAVAFDGAGSLLVGTNDGLARFDGRSFEPVPLPAEGVVWRLTAAPDGAVWGLTTEGTLFRLAPDGTARRIPTPAPLRTRLREQIWPIKLRADGRGRLWLSGGEADEAGQAPALFRWEPGRRVWTRHRVPGAGRIKDFFVRGDGDDGALVVAARGRVGEIPLRRGRLGPPRWMPLDADTHFIRPHPTALAWVGAMEGVFLLGRDGRARRVTGDGDAATWLHSEPAVDAAGRLLAAIDRRGAGLKTERLAPDGTVERSLGGDEGLASALPVQLAFDPEGALWIAHIAGLTTLEEERAVALPLVNDVDGPSYVNGMAGDPAAGVLWVSTYGGVMHRLDGPRLVVAYRSSRQVRAPVVGADGEADWEEVDGAVRRGRSSRAGGAVRTRVLVYDGPAGRYETDAAGLWRARGGRRTRLGPDALPGAVASEGADGRLWLTSESGRLDVVWVDTLASACPACLPRSLRATLDTLNARFSVNAVAADRWGRVWVAGATGGLAVAYPRPDGAWTHREFGTEDGLLARKVDALDVSPDGRRLWLATWRGIQGLRLGPGPPRLDPFAELRARDGLPGEVTARVLEDSDGMLWAALVLGKIHRLDWRALTERRPSPSVHVERVEVNGRAVAAGAAGLRLREGDGLAVGLWPQTYRQPLRVRLEYRLGARDTAWTDVGPARRLAFASLPSGRYALDVRAVREGQAPGPAVRLALAVAPVFWRTGWFAALVALALVLAGAGVYRVRAGRRRAAEDLRFRIATDLHDEMGGGLSQVSLLSELIRRTAEGTAGAPAGDDAAGGDGALGDDRTRMAAWAARVGEQARALSGSVRDVAWAIRPDEGGWDDLELRMKDAAVALLAPRGVALDWQGTTAGTPPPLSPAVRQNVLFFFKEAVYNAARHGAPARVEVRWALSPRTLHLRVCDDGAGFDPASVRPGTGLVSMRRRAADLGGTLGVGAAPGAGTSLTLDVPLGRHGRGRAAPDPSERTGDTGRGAV